VKPVTERDEALAHDAGCTGAWVAREPQGLRQRPSSAMPGLCPQSGSPAGRGVGWEKATKDAVDTRWRGSPERRVAAARLAGHAAQLRRGRRSMARAWMRKIRLNCTEERDARGSDGWFDGEEEQQGG
jgi:hypothetical protein